MSMFCFQCEQTAGCNGCTKVGVCGKQPDTAQLQDELTGALINLALAAKGKEHKVTPELNQLVLEGLFITVTNVSFDNEQVQRQIDKTHEATLSLLPQCGCCAAHSMGKDYDLEEIWNEPDEDIRSLKSLILFGIRGIAAYAYHAMVLGYTDDTVNRFMLKALRTISLDFSMEELLPIVMETGEVNLTCMELLDRANRETYGNPVPTTVPLSIEPGPFIVVSGHDLHDLALLLEQTKDKGINIYTHGEMLPCHAYPKLKEYPHLKGNFGTAWQNQQKEFATLPAPILFTTNCLMPPRPSYEDRIYTTSVVGYEGMVHIEGTKDGKKDFTPIIKHALKLGGYEHDHSMSGINGGHILTTGFAHGAVLSHADKLTAAIKNGDIKHIFLVGGCDGAHPGRNYYTEFVKQTPMDSLVLTLACGKYRFNDLDLGEIDGIPRILDMGQCNDSYSAIKVALALAEAFNCDINELPLTLVLSWYEQKAVCILLTLLALGVKNIYLGPTLPAFMTETVVRFLVDTYNLQPITAPEQDMDAILGRG